MAFLLDDIKVKQDLRLLIEYVHQSSHYETPILISGYVDSKNKIRSEGRKVSLLSEIFQRVLRSLLIKIIIFLEAGRVKKEFRNYDLVEEPKCLAEIQKIKVVGSWSKSNLFLEMTEEDLSKIQKENIDCIIRGGSGILRGAILESAKYGILSFHHGDNRKYRGGPSGFWEVLNCDPTSGFLIQKLNEELDGGEVLLRGNIMTSNSWLMNSVKLQRKSFFFMRVLLESIATNQKLPKCEGIILCGRKLYKLDSVRPLIRYFLSVLFPNVMRKLISVILSQKTKRWQIAVAKHEKFSKALWRYKEVKNPRGRFFADPFVFSCAAGDYIFVEDYVYGDKKGRISCLKAEGEECSFVGVAIEEDCHMSFPFVFSEGGDIYMIPETAGKREVRLYKCDNFPLDWSLTDVLLENVDAVDSMVVKIDKIWYLLTNICSANIGDHNSELHVFYSKSLIGGEWEPISSGNPVIFDSNKARNAGLLSHEGELYRLNQVHEKDFYGKQFCINKIKRISVDSYEEEESCLIDSAFKEDQAASHHYSANDKIAAVDFAKFTRLRKVRDHGAQ